MVELLADARLKREDLPSYPSHPAHHQHEHEMLKSIPFMARIFVENNFSLKDLTTEKAESEFTDQCHEKLLKVNDPTVGRSFIEHGRKKLKRLQHLTGSTTRKWDRTKRRTSLI